MSMKPRAQWRDHGVKVIPGSQLDLNTPQTPSMTRAAAITYARTGASKLWAGTFTVEPNAKTGAHHHGELESVIYVVRGRARMRWGSISNSLPKQDLATLSIFHRSCLIRRSMRVKMRSLAVLSREAVRSQ